MQPKSKSLEIRECIFQLTVTQATAHIKFPCSFFLQWKTTDNKHSVQSPNRFKANHGVITFNQQLSLSVLMLYNLRLNHYRKKQSIVLLNLLSNSRPNDPKLVGRFEIDLATIANKNHLNQLTQYPLKYCSVEGSITLKAHLRQQKITNFDPNDLERSECSQSQIFGSEFGLNKEEVKASVSSQSALSNQTGQGVGSKIDTQNLLNVLDQSKLPTHKEKFKSPQNPQSKKHIRIQTYSKENNEYKSQSNDIEGGLQKRLKNDFSIPRLVKNSSEFDSSKMNSQKTLKNQMSQKSLKKLVLLQSPKVQQYLSNQFSKKIIQQNNLPQVVAVNINPTEINQKNIQHITDYSLKDGKLIFTQVEISKLKQQNDVLKRKIEQMESQFKTKQTNFEKLVLEIIEKSKLIEQKDHTIQQQYVRLEEINLEKKELEEQNKQLKMNLKSPQYQHQNLSYFPDDKFDELHHKYQTEMQNYQNTKLELEQLREWYNELQKQKQKLSEDKQKLQQRIFQIVQKSNNQQTENIQLQKIKQNYQLQLQSKKQEIEALMSITLEKGDNAEIIQKQLTQSISQIQSYRDKLSLQEEKTRSLTKNINELNEKINLLEVNLQQKQILLLELSEQLRVTKQTIVEQEREIEEHKRIKLNSQKQKEQVMEQQQNKLKDLVARMKDKEESIARLQRQKQQIQFKLKQSQFTNEQYKQKLKKQDVEKTKSLEKSNLIQKQNKQNIRQLQLVNRKIVQEADNFNKIINKLKQSLEEQTQKRKQIQKALRQFQSSQFNSAGNIKQMQVKINGFLKRQAILKDNLQIVQSQMTKITQILIEKQQNEEYFNQTIINLNRSNSQLILKISELENQLITTKQRCEALQAQVQLLNAYMPEQQDQTQLLDINKRLNDKNKQLLDIIEQKNRVLSLLQKSQEQSKFIEAKKQLANSRQLKQMTQLHNKLVVLQDQNEKAYKELERLNIKYSEELNILQASNEERVKELLSTIQRLNNRLKALQSKDWQSFNQSKLLKEQMEKFQQSLNEKQFQVEIYKNQIKQQNQTIESLQSQLNVLNSQYENIYSQMGQKQFQLYQANAKLKQLQQTIQAKKDLISYKNENQTAFFEEEKKKYQKNIYQLQEKCSNLKNQQQQMASQSEELRLKVQQLQKTLNQSNFQLQSYKSNQKQYEQKINQIQQQQKVVISSLKESQQKQQIENEIYKRKTVELEAEINHLKIQQINAKMNQSLIGEYSNVKQSQPTTPIQQFKQSSLLKASRQKQNVNLREIVHELTTIINKRKEQEQVEGVLRLVIDNNARQEEQFERWNRQRGAMQQKAKLASKQLQKAKSAIMKNTNRSIAQKSQITSLLRPIEGVIGQLIQLSQNLSELDLEGQFQEDQLQIDQKEELGV